MTFDILFRFVVLPIFGLCATAGVVWNVIGWWRDMTRQVDEWTNEIQ